jgi:hypothetical protein
LAQPTRVERHHVGQQLGRVPRVGQPVPHRHAGIRRELLHRPVGEATELDSVEHPAEHPGRVGHRLLLAELDVALAEVLGVGTLVDAGHREGAPGAGRRLLEQQRDREPVERPLADSRPFFCLQLHRQPQQLADLLRREIEQLQE